MNSLKAITAGSLIIFISNLLLQLAALFIIVGYKELSKGYPFLTDISGTFRYLIAIPAFILTMFVGGYITAFIAKTRVLLHCMIVALITTGGMFWMVLVNAEMTTTGIVIAILMIVATIAGGRYQQVRV